MQPKFNSQQCRRLFIRCADNEARGILPMHVLAEAQHVLMLAEARDIGLLTGGSPAKQLSAKPDHVKQLVRYEEIMRDILAIGLQLEPLTHEDFLTAMTVQRRFGLLTNGALSVAIAKRLRTKTLASADKAFARVQGLLVYAPDDLASSASRVF